MKGRGLGLAILWYEWYGLDGRGWMDLGSDVVILSCDGAVFRKVRVPVG